MGIYLLYTFCGLLIPCLVRSDVDLLLLTGDIINNINTLTSKDWHLLWKLGPLHLPDISYDLNAVTIQFSGNDLKYLDFIIRGRDHNGKCVRSQGYASTISKTNEGKFTFNFTDTSFTHRIYWIIGLNENYFILYSCESEDDRYCKENMVQIFSIHTTLSNTNELNDILSHNLNLNFASFAKMEWINKEPCTEHNEKCIIENFPIITKPDFNLLNGDWYVIRYYGAHPVIFPRGSRSLAVTIKTNNGMIWIKFHIRNSEGTCIDSKEGNAILFDDLKHIMRFSIQGGNTDLVVLEHNFEKNPVFYFCENMLLNGTCSQEKILVLVLSQQNYDYQQFAHLEDICIDPRQVTSVDFSREKACGIDKATATKCILENFPIATKTDFSLLNGDWYVIGYYGAHSVIFPKGCKSLAVSIATNNGMLWINFHIRNSEGTCIDSKQGSAILFDNRKNIMKFSIQGGNTDLVILEQLFDKNPLFYFCDNILTNGTCSQEKILLLILSQQNYDYQEFAYLEDICIDPRQVTKVDFSQEKACGIDKGTINYFGRWPLLLVIISLVIS